jgi:hypothetical protein
MLLELMPATEEKKAETEAEAAPKRRRLSLPGRRAKPAAETATSEKAESAPAKKRGPARKKTTAGAKEA